MTTQEPIDRAASPQKVAANQANAQRSTGPRTEAGKEHSSRNAIKSGAWARELHPIEAGPFQEDRDVFFQRAEDLIDSFSPETPGEMALAKRAASALIRLDRADRFEAALLLESNLVDEEGQLLFPSPAALDQAAAEVDLLLDHFEVIAGRKEPDEDSVRWTLLGIALRKHCPNSKVTIEGLLTREVRPESDEQWHLVVTAIFRHFWADDERAYHYFDKRHDDLLSRAASTRYRFDALMAKRALNLSADQLDRPRTAAWREFDRAYTALIKLQDRRWLAQPG